MPYKLQAMYLINEVLILGLSLAAPGLTRFLHPNHTNSFLNTSFTVINNSKILHFRQEQAENQLTWS